MPKNFIRMLFIVLAFIQLAGCATSTGFIVEPPVSSDPYRLVVSVHDQQMRLLKGSAIVANYRISTSANGVGEAVDSYRTPRGRHAIAEKIGAGMPIGTGFVDRLPTKEIVTSKNAGQIIIVTRILRLRGLEDKNQTTFERYIYLNGTPFENSLGKPASGGNIRMRSVEIVDLFERVEVGTEVFIFEEPLSAAIALLAESDAKLAAPK